MPIIYLRHPVHGTKVANMEEEANADVANGWRVYNPIEQRGAKPVNNLAEVEKVEEVEEVAEVEEQPVEIKRRRRN